jgi:putative transposase
MAAQAGPAAASVTCAQQDGAKNRADGVAARLPLYPRGVAYKHRIQAPGFYHVVCRGNNKRTIFKNQADRQFFLDMLDRVATKYGWTLYAYCLMGNHYHLVLEVGELGMSKGMCELHTAYATEFNRRHGRINHLFGKRYWSDRLGDERRFLNTIRYVFENPRRAGRAGPLEAYRWSSYQATVGLALSTVRLARDRLLAHFAGTPSAAIAKLVEFCEAPAPPERAPRRQPP